MKTSNLQGAGTKAAVFVQLIGDRDGATSGQQPAVPPRPATPRPARHSSRLALDAPSAWRRRRAAPVQLLVQHQSKDGKTADGTKVSTCEPLFNRGHKVEHIIDIGARARPPLLLPSPPLARRLVVPRRHTRAHPLTRTAPQIP